MNIIYSINNNINAEYNAKNITNSLKDHKIFIAGFSNDFFKEINWNLNALYIKSTVVYNKFILNDLFENKTIPILNENIGKCLLKQVELFKPDLIISDNESIFRCIANKLNIELWNVSGALAHRAYMFGTYRTYFKVWEQTKLFKDYLIKEEKPVCDKFLYYSPFEILDKKLRNKSVIEKIVPDITLDLKYNSDIHISILNKKRLLKLKKVINKLSVDYKVSISFHNLKSEFPFCEFLNSENVNCKFTISCGNSTELAIAFIKKSNIITIPDINDLESCFNALGVKVLNYGDDLGQLELMDNYAEDYINESLNMKYDFPKIIGGDLITSKLLK